MGNPGCATLSMRGRKSRIQPDAELDALWRKFKADPTHAARNVLVERYMGLVKHQAECVRRRLPDSVELDDLVSAGVFGLLQAIDAFDLERGNKFETYCVPRVRGAILDELRETDWVPRSVRTKAKEVDAARQEVERHYGRPAAAAEVARRLGLTMEEFGALSAEIAPVAVVSLDKALNDVDRGRFARNESKAIRGVDRVPDEKAEDPSGRLMSRDRLNRVLRSCSRQERLVVLMYYQLDMTFKVIGESLDLSESRISQAHTALIARLRGDAGLREAVAS